VAFLLSYLRVPLTWRDVFRKTLTEAFFRDNVFGLAAQLAFYYFFALFPALLVLIAFASFFPLERMLDTILGALSGVAPPEVLTIVADQAQQISEERQGGLLTVGLIVAFWTTSTAMTAVIDTLNRAYGVEDSRPFWHVRLTAIALSLGVTLFVLTSFALVLLGPQLAERLAPVPAVEWTLKILQWPVVFALASFGIAIVYYFAPDVEQDWVWLTPGSVFATMLWLAASLGFRIYVVHLGAYTETYGAIGGVMVLMLWFYISGLAMLLGAEMNAEIEHASPYGKDDGEKVKGQKRVIGPAAMRLWIAKRRAKGELPPSPDEIDQVKESVERHGDARAAVPDAPPVTQPVASHAAGPRAPARATRANRALRPADWLLAVPLLALHCWWTIRAVRRS
jgi:membrane protein